MKRKTNTGWGGPRPNSGKPPTKRATIELGETVAVIVRTAEGQAPIELMRLASVSGKGHGNKLIVLEAVDPPAKSD